MNTLYIDLGASRVKWLVSNKIKYLSSGALENKYITNARCVEIDFFDLTKKIKKLILKTKNVMEFVEYFFHLKCMDLLFLI